MKFKRRHGEIEQGCLLSESYTATDALPQMLPSLSPTDFAGLRVRYLRHRSSPETFFFSENLFVNRFVRDERRSRTKVPLYYNNFIL
jgi:hypothetical protein